MTSPTEQIRRGSPETFGLVLRRAAARYGRRLAVTDRSGRDRTYAQLIERGSRLANVIRGLGANPGDRVAVMLEDRTEAVEVWVGVVLSGCTLVHVNARHTAAELTHVLNDSGAILLIHTAGVAEAVTGAGESALRTRIEIGGSDREVEPSTDYEQLLARASSLPPSDGGQAEDIAVIGYTSGTTGRPKGAMISHRALVNCVRVSPYYYELPPGSRIAYSASVSFVATVWAQILPTLWFGGTVDLLGRLEADGWVDRIVATQANYTFLASPRIAEFMEQITRRPEALRSLKVIMHSGSAAPREQLVALGELIGARLRESYGSTEVVGCITATQAADYLAYCAADDLLASVGQVLPSAALRVAGPDGEPLAPGEAGQLTVHSDSMFSGYWNDPDKTAAAFSNGWFRMQDIGYVDQAGYLYVVARTADLIVSGGANVYPAEVERVIGSHPSVADVAVVGLPHPRWGESVAAAIVPKAGKVLTEQELIAHASGELAGYKKPTRVFILDQLPVNSNQKLDRVALRAQLQAQVDADAALATIDTHEKSSS